jgi:hypothetical protein
MAGAVARLSSAARSGAPNYRDKASRHFFALNTCTGCHGRKPTRPSFIDPRTGGASDFLNGISVADPGHRSRPFAELEQRRKGWRFIRTAVGSLNESPRSPAGALHRPMPKGLR